MNLVRAVDRALEDVREADAAAGRTEPRTAARMMKICMEEYTDAEGRIRREWANNRGAFFTHVQEECGISRSTFNRWKQMINDAVRHRMGGMN